MGILTKSKAKLADRRGFSLAEVLLAVAILVILFALLVPNLIQMQKRLRQKELDAKAEIIYTAVQNQLIKLRASGNAERYQNGFSEAAALSKNEFGIDSLSYFTSEERDLIAAVMTDGTMDATLLNGHWVVEFNPDSGYVYSVFYSEKRADLPANYRDQPGYFNTLRQWYERLEAGAVIGYYDGRALMGTPAEELEDDNQLFYPVPLISVNNGEKLTVTLQCMAPSSNQKDQMRFDLTISDGAGSRTMTLTPSSSPRLQQFGRNYYIELTLDDLSSPSTRFSALYGAYGFVPGNPLTLTLTVDCPNNDNVQSKSVSAVTNSLFADGSNTGETAGTAIVSCGRHLQNLDESSGAQGIAAAVQQKDIDFGNDDGWLAPGNYEKTYFNGLSDGKPNFKPVENSELKSYDGGKFHIAGLNGSTDGDAGLFARIDGDTTLKQIVLTGSAIRGGTAGALVGTVTGNDNLIQNCASYLERSDYQGKTDGDRWITADGAAGGLIGTLAGGSLKIQNSFAASVLSGDAYAGGLVGNVGGGTLSLLSSYADCYLTAAQTGGLVGGGNAASVQNCYAAGFQTATLSAAGLVNGAVTGTLKSSYAVCDYDSAPTAHATVAAYSGSTGISAVYYLVGSSGGGATIAAAEPIGAMSSASLCAALNSGAGTAAFQTDTKGTVAYRLRGQALDNYIFPRLTANKHYGDWQSGFQAGALVYYEKYSDHTYGFYGAGVQSALDEVKPIVGDGYGVVLEHSTISRVITVTVNGGVIDLSGVTPLPVTTEDGSRYDIYPLPKTVVCATPTAGAGFYTKALITVTTAGETTESTYSFNPHFAKTAALMPDPTQEPLAPTEEKEKPIIIRTARHLYALSLYYDDYWHDATLHCLYEQERDISYSVYDWTTYSTYGASVTRQRPIGARIPWFQAGYDGKCHTISDVSFIAEGSSYIGMFGSSDCYLRNIVLVTDYDPKTPQRHFYIRRTKNIGTNETVAMGVLIGRNQGTLYNCAVAGYYIAGSDGTIHAYANSTLFVGGLVGLNEGSIASCTAGCPTIRLSCLDATVAAGGLVGRNAANGYIRNCYALEHIEVAEARRGTVAAAGFAGANDGQIRASYCASSLVTNGDAVSYGFAPKTGIVSADCYYLNAGTYYYVGTLRDYSAVASATSATPVTYQQLKQMRGIGNSAANSLHHINTTAASYPFPAVLRRNGTLVHYGDWQDVPALGTFGVFYWEHEVGGSNNGYHISFLGTDVGSATAGSTLCTAHDDDGYITEFGYGYYALKGQENDVELITDGIARGDAWNTEAQEELERQMFGYVFYPFTTRVADSGDYLYLANGEAPTGVWTLRHGSERYRYAIAPFFAGAMQRLDVTGAIPSVGTDGTVRDHAKNLGSAENPFEVRSAQQLQYINWNSASQSCATLVTKESATYQKYPYLMYTNGTGKQSLDGASGASVAGRVAAHDWHWRQSHDVDGSGMGRFTPIAGSAVGTDTNNAKSRLYAWFGSYYDGESYKLQNFSVESDCYTVGLFGVTVGANISNVILYSDNGSTIKRATPTASPSDPMTGAYYLGGMIALAYDYDTKTTNTSTNRVNTIENCAIAGYRIVDASTNQQGRGHANIGGLIGMACVNLERCSAVTRIQVECMHRNGHAMYGSYGHVGGLTGSAKYRVKDCYTGGSIYVAENTRNELYINGEYYDLGDQSEGGDYERMLAKLTEMKGFLRQENVHIYIGGVSGGVYSCEFENFNGGEDGQPIFENCYAFTSLPTLQGTIKGVSLFATVGDRYGKNSSGVTMTNCYYLQDVRDALPYDGENGIRQPAYWFKGSSGNAAPTASQPYRITSAEWDAMLFGNTTVNKKIISGDSGNPKLNLTGLGSVSYEELDASYTGASGAMTSRLGQGRTVQMNGTDVPVWDWVTVTEGSGGNTARIDGKYSFSDNGAQTGKNYPFPTVVRQKDLTFGGYVNVHYGAWPTNGAYWTNGLDSMDIFSDMQSSGEAEKPFTLHLTQLPGTSGAVVFTDEGTAELTDWTAEEDAETGSVAYVCADTDLRFSLSPAGKAELVGVTLDRNAKTCAVTLRALDLGSVAVTETGSDASFTLSVTAALSLSADPTELMLYSDVPEQIAFTATATDDESKHFETRGTWTISATGDADIGAFEIEQAEETAPNIWKVTGFEPGERTLAATITYPYHGTDLSATILFETTVKGGLGLSNGTAVNLAARRASGSVSGSDTELSLEDAPEGPELFLFAPTVDRDLADFIIERITVAPAGGAAVTVFDRAAPDSADTGDYRVTFTAAPEDAEEEDAYRFWTAAVRRSADAAATVRVTVTLTDPNGVTAYELSLGGVSAARYGISFDADGASGRMLDAGHNGGDYTLPDCRFTRTGYSFCGWLSDGWAEPLAAGEAVAIDADTVLTAAWTPITYTLRFEPGLGSGEAVELAVLYDADAVLPTIASLGFTGPEEATIPDGWNTAAEGGGTACAEGATVCNLSAEDGAVLSFFAQWKNRHSLRLLAGAGDAADYDASELDGLQALDLAALSDAPDKPGWTLDGWYTERTTAQISVKILNADGSIAAGAGDTAGVTENGVFALTEDLTLYARWSRTAFVQVGALQETGRYLIASGASEETLQLMTLQSGAKLGAAEADVFHGTFLDGGGSEHTDAAYIDAPAENAKWTASYSSAAGFIGYRFEQELGGTAYYLRRDNDTTKELAVRTDYLYNGGLSDRYIWHYDEIPNMWAQKDGRNMTLGLAGGKWKTGEGLQSRIFREQTIYTFDPDAFSS